VSDLPARIAPVPNAETTEYWAGCRRHELLIQRCTGCNALQFYPRCLCTSCGGDGLAWLPACGRGTVETYSVVRHAVSKAYAAELPFLLVLVRLEEGPTMMSTLVDCAIDEASIGMPVEVVFDDRAEGYTLPRFRPRAPGGA
jgi:uncharacterized protein